MSYCQGSLGEFLAGRNLTSILTSSLLRDPPDQYLYRRNNRNCSSYLSNQRIPFRSAAQPRPFSTPLFEGASAFFAPPDPGTRIPAEDASAFYSFKSTPSLLVSEGLLMPYTSHCLFSFFSFFSLCSPLLSLLLHRWRRPLQLTISVTVLILSSSVYGRTSFSLYGVHVLTLSERGRFSSARISLQWIIHWQGTTLFRMVVHRFEWNYAFKIGLLNGASELFITLPHRPLKMIMPLKGLTRFSPRWRQNSCSISEDRRWIFMPPEKNTILPVQGAPIFCGNFSPVLLDFAFSSSLTQI